MTLTTKKTKYELPWTVIQGPRGIMMGGMAGYQDTSDEGWLTIGSPWDEPEMTQANTVLARRIPDLPGSNGVYKVEFHLAYYPESNGCLAKWTERS
jgi:hypothetical protein